MEFMPAASPPRYRFIEVAIAVKRPKVAEVHAPRLLPRDRPHQHLGRIIDIRAFRAGVWPAGCGILVTVHRRFLLVQARSSVPELRAFRLGHAALGRVASQRST